MKLNFKEKYLIILVALSFVVIGLYYSYAIFVTKQLQENVLVVKLENKSLILKVNGVDSKVKVEKNTNKEYQLSFHNTNALDFNYLVLVKGIKTGIKVYGNDNKGVVKANENKEITVNINNTLNEDVNLEFIVKIGNNILDKDINTSYVNDIENYDHSMANEPNISNLKLIPVVYEKTSDTEGYWIKADINNKDSLWYDYDHGMWANAVLLNDTNYKKYQRKAIGTEIEIGDIEGFYVWIPRFKYFVVNNSSYTNYERMTNIIFEKGNETTGTTSCTDSISNQTDKHIFSEKCSDSVYNHIYDNLSTYTHPAFKDKSGFWVSKFLVGENNKVLPNVNMIKRNISRAIEVSKMINNSHVLTNMEYGALVLLTNSSYGKTGNVLYNDDNINTFKRVYNNSYVYDVTGCSSPYSKSSKSFINSLSKVCVEYNDLTDLTHYSNGVKYPVGYKGAGASSTGNVYGVYDLSNKNGELTASFVAKEDGSTDITTTYYDVYSYSEYTGLVSSSSNIYNLYRYKLGDGIREHFRTMTINGMWNGGVLSQNKNSGIIIRGGSGDMKNASIYSTTIEGINYVAPFRLVLITK